MHTTWFPFALLLLSIGPAALPAQERAQRADSLEREVRILKERLDSLQHVLERLTRERRDTSGVTDELAALRAAAQRAAPQPTADTLEDQAFVIRARDLNRLNPEISVTGDVRMRGVRPGPQQDNVQIREFCLSFQSPLDPFSNTKIFLSFGEGHAEVEEAYGYWTGLPGGLRLDIGRLRQQVGELNRWHLHALPESEYPLAIREYFGHHGLVGDGLGLYWIAPVASPGGGVHELWGQVTLANNEVLFDGGRRLSALGHINNFWQVSRSTYFQVGGTALYGENPDSLLRSRLFAADFRLTWRPPGQALYRSATLRGEGFAVRRSIDGPGETRYGGYLGTEFQVSRRIQLGGRLDYVQPVDLIRDHVWGFSPHLTWWQSEWVFLRAEWQHLVETALSGTGVSSDLFLVQVVWSIGPHKHEAY